MPTTMDCGPTVAALLGQLSTPTRNRYYFGKLLDADHFQLEQDYGNRKRWLLNRLSLGSGVLCGLEVTVSADGTQALVGPGVAIDPLGREVVVPSQSPGVNILQPTDACGQPVGTALQAPATVTLYACYHECEAEPAPVMVSECGPDRNCECGLVRERYRLQIRTEGIPPRPLDCGSFFSTLPSANDPDRRRRLCGILDGACGKPSETCVPLAVISVPAAGAGAPTIDQCGARTMVYSNAVLLDLILCLAERVDACCGGSTPVTPAPQVTAVWPANAAVMSPTQWRGAPPHVALTFTEAMSAKALAAPDPWLGVFSVQLPTPTAAGNAGQAKVTRLKLQPTASANSLSASYAVDGAIGESYFLVLIDANGGSIQDAQTPPLSLEADYAGTGLTAPIIQNCLALKPGKSAAIAIAAAAFTTPGASLPSGQDGIAGGIFSSWFQVTST
jgi:hypothetical protein